MATTAEPAGSDVPRRASPDLCQLVWLDDALDPLNAFERFARRARTKWLGALRRLGILPYDRIDRHRSPPWRRAIEAMVSTLRQESTDAARGGESSGAGGAEGAACRASDDERRAGAAARRRRTPLCRSGHLEAGDLVQVRPLEEILETLDERHKYGRLSFLRPMAEHCGKTYRVLKRVRHLVNDRDHTVSKVRDTVLLDGVMCHGTGVYGREDCDRSCFFFWKEVWLRRIDEP